LCELDECELDECDIDELDELDELRDLDDEFGLLYILYYIDKNIFITFVLFLPSFIGWNFS
jgi:hypothetical protein